MSSLSRRIGVALHVCGSRVANVWRAREANEQVQVQVRVDRLLSLVNEPTLRAVLQLHLPVHEREAPYPVCRGCDTDGPDDEPPAWPCSTWRLIEQHAVHR